MEFIEVQGRKHERLFPAALDDLVPADYVCRVVDAFVNGLMGFALVAALDCRVYRSDGAAGWQKNGTNRGDNNMRISPRTRNALTFTFAFALAFSVTALCGTQTHLS
jgi:hypothetical protein